MKSSLTQAYTLKLDAFEGPFDLLFHLIEKHQIDLYDIPILSIASQYLEYLQAMQELDLEVASEFLVMAATLLHIKSRMLLPVLINRSDELPEDPRELLVQQLVAYRKFKELALDLRERGEVWSCAYFKIPEPLPELVAEPIRELSSLALRECYEAALKKARSRLDLSKNRMARILDNERVSLRAKVHEILHSLELLAKGARLKFSQLFDIRKKSRLEVATAFLAMLEVVKLGRAGIDQQSMFDDIWLDHIESKTQEKSDVIVKQ